MSAEKTGLDVIAKPRKNSIIVIFFINNFLFVLTFEVTGRRSPKGGVAVPAEDVVKQVYEITNILPGNRVVSTVNVNAVAASRKPRENPGEVAFVPLKLRDDLVRVH